MEYKDIATKNESPTKEEIEICEKVLKWCAEANFIQFNDEDCQVVLSKTTNILRWNSNIQVIRLPFLAGKCD